MNHQYCYSWYFWSNSNRTSQIRSKIILSFNIYNFYLKQEQCNIITFIVLVLDKNCSLFSKNIFKVFLHVEQSVLKKATY